MLKRAFYICALIAGLAGLGTSSARAVTVDVFAQANSSTGGAGALTGVFLTLGQAFTVSAGLDDLWSAGALPRWSNADGLTGDRFVTGTDESGEAAGIKIGIDFGTWLPCAAHLRRTLRQSGGPNRIRSLLPRRH